MQNAKRDTRYEIGNTRYVRKSKRFTSYVSRFADPKGQSLLEVLGALAVLVIAILSLVTVNTRSVYQAAFARDQALATRHAQEIIEKIRVYREQNSWTTFSSDCGPSMPGLDPLSSPFDFSVSCVCSADSCDIQVVVDWTDAQGTHRSELTTRLTNWR